MKMKHQSKILNELCAKTSTTLEPQKKDLVSNLAACQTFMVESISSLAQAELNHVETVA